MSEVDRIDLSARFGRRKPPATGTYAQLDAWLDDAGRVRIQEAKGRVTEYVPAPAAGAVGRQAVARAIWTAMVDDEPPFDDDTIWREGYLDAADAVIALFTTQRRAM